MCGRLIGKKDRIGVKVGEWLREMRDKISLICSQVNLLDYSTINTAKYH